MKNVKTFFASTVLWSIKLMSSSQWLEFCAWREWTSLWTCRVSNDVKQNRIFDTKTKIEAKTKTVHQCVNGRAPPYLSEHCIARSQALTRGGLAFCWSSLRCAKLCSKLRANGRIYTELYIFVNLVAFAVFHALLPIALKGMIMRSVVSVRTSVYLLYFPNNWPLTLMYEWYVNWSWPYFAGDWKSRL